MVCGRVDPQDSSARWGMTCVPRSRFETCSLLPTAAVRSALIYPCQSGFSASQGNRQTLPPSSVDAEVLVPAILWGTVSSALTGRQQCTLDMDHQHLVGVVRESINLVAHRHATVSSKAILFVLVIGVVFDIMRQRLVLVVRSTDVALCGIP